MDKQKLVPAALVAASMAIGGVLGAVAFTPRAGEASPDVVTTTLAAETGEEEGPWHLWMACARALAPGGLGVRPLEVAAEAIGIETTELAQALEEGDTIADVAEANDVEPEEVVDAIVEAVRARLETVGGELGLSAEQVDRLLETAERRGRALVHAEPGSFPWPGHGVAVGGLLHDAIANALEELGLDLSDVLEELRDGRTVAEIAEEHRVDVDVLLDDVAAAFRERLDPAVDRGRLTEEEADEHAATVRDRLNAVVNEPFPFPLLGLPHGPSGPWGRGAFGPGPRWHGGAFGPGPGWGGTEGWDELAL